MANQLFQGFVYDDAGAPIVGATVNLYDRNTTTPVRATTTTDANGLWTISHATEGRFDVEIVNGSSKRRRKYDDQIQVDTIELANLNIRNPADTFDYSIVPAAIVADRQLNLPLLTGTDEVVVKDLAQTLTNKTLTAPTIADFTNANHDHGDADDGGAVVFAALSNGVKTIRKTADETVNNSTTLQDDDHFTFSIAANEVWAIQMYLDVIVTSAEDFKYTFSLPAGASMLLNAMSLNGSSPPELARSSGSTPGTGIAHATASGAGPVWLEIKGVLINGANAGSATFQWAQNTAVVVDTIIEANSFMVANRIA